MKYSAYLVLMLLFFHKVCFEVILKVQWNVLKSVNETSALRIHKPFYIDNWKKKKDLLKGAVFENKK